MSVIQNDDNSDLDLPSSQAIESSQSTTGTRIGEVTDFEKDLIANDVIEEKSVVLEETPVKDTNNEVEDLFESHLNDSFNDYLSSFYSSGMISDIPT